MTIHHDKLAYGKLAPNREDADEEKLKKMAQKLSQQQPENEQNSLPDGKKGDNK